MSKASEWAEQVRGHESALHAVKQSIPENFCLHFGTHCLGKPYPWGLEDD